MSAFAERLRLLREARQITQTSLDELAGRSASITEPKIHNVELLNLYQQVDSLPDTDQQALVSVIDGLVKKSQMQKVVGQRPSKRAARVAASVLAI
jgi:hypothetical protein